MSRLHSETPHPQNSQPLWLVTDGDLTVGPVPTSLLLRGITHGRVPDSCRVREIRWESWRALAQIREVSALRRRLARGIVGGDASVLSARPARPVVSRLRHASSTDEVVLFSLSAAVALTGAEVGLVHTIHQAWQPPTTRCVHGLNLLPLLGLPVPANDLSLGAARAGRSFYGQGDASAVHSDAAARLGHGSALVTGVAMAPICRGRELLAMVELGRSDHAFRQTDLTMLQRLLRVALRRIEELS